MHLHLLFSELDGAAPITRVFLIRFLKRYGESCSVGSSIREFVSELGINDRGVRCSLKFLVDKDYLCRESRPSGGRGRPKQAYRVGETLERLVDELSLVVGRPLFSDQINGVLDERHAPRSEGHAMLKVGLKSFEGLLLAVLYAHADSEGLVRGLGFAKIRAFTGLTKSQIRSRIESLKKQGRITSYKPGRITKEKEELNKSTFKLALPNSPALRTSYLTLRLRTLNQLRYAMLLAQALVTLNYVKVEPTPDKDIDHWIGIYKIKRNLFDNVADCKEYLWDFCDVRGYKFYRLLSHICHLVGKLAFKEFEEISPKQIGKWIARHNLLPQYLRKYTNASVESRIRFVSYITYELYNEVMIELSKIFEGKAFQSIQEISISVGRDDAFLIGITTNPNLEDNEDMAHLKNT